MRKLFPIAGLCLLGSSALADSDMHPVTLWEARGDSNIVYLLGSIHLLRSEDHPLPAVIENAYQEAEVIFMEIDMDDIDPFAAQAAFTEFGVLHDDTTLQDLMGADDYERALAAAEKIDIPLHLLNKTEPWYAALTVEMLALGRLGFDANLGVETYMTNKARNDGKPIEGFESVEEQLAFLDGLSLPAQRQMLVSTLEESALLKDTMESMITAWRHGDVEYLETELLRGFAEFEELNQAILVNRNNRWVARISELLDDEQDYLIVVGALHLIGEDGVPLQLAGQGVEIRQLSESPSVR